MARKNARSTRSRIISAAWELFYENGYDDTTVEDIVQRSQTSKGSFYHYFSGKDQLLSSLSTLFDEKYEELADYREKLLSECFVAIRRMWVSFESYSREDRARAEATVREMQAFSKKHFAEVMRGEYSARAKITCLLSQSRSAPAMWAGACGGKLWRAFWRRKNEMFE